MRHRLFSLFIYMLCAAASWAGGIMATDVSLKAGETGVLTLSLMPSASPCAGVQFDLALADGFALETTDGRVDCTIAAGQPSDVTCSIVHQGNGYYRLMLFSTSLKGLAAGELLNLRLTAVSYLAEGSYPMDVYNVMWSDIEGTVTREKSASFRANITESAEGIMADLKVEALSIGIGETKPLTLSLGSKTKNCAGIQFDMSLPNGFSLAETDGTVACALPDRLKGSLTCTIRKQGTGLYRFMVYSNTLQTLEEGELLTVSLVAGASVVQNSYQVYVKGLKASNANGQVVEMGYVSGQVDLSSGAMTTLSATVPAMHAGETTAMTLSLSEDTKDCAGVQFDLLLPAGFALKETDGKIVATVSSGQAPDIVCNIQSLGDATYRFMTYSASLQLLKGGDLLSLNLKADGTVAEGSYNVKLRQVLASDINGSVASIPNATATVNVLAAEIRKGDANGDYVIDVGDVVATVNVILGRPTAGFIVAAADVNGDGIIDVSDVVAIVNIILGRASARAMDGQGNELTVISAVKNSGKAETNDKLVWHDLRGRKLEAAPTTKGIYLKNGKKVVVK